MTPSQPRPQGPQESESPDLGLLLAVMLAAIRDALDELEEQMSQDLILRLFALRSAIERYREANHP